jgi:hypothetical protein
MKITRQILTLLLSVYLLALMVLPCNDDHSHAQVTTENQIAQADNHHDDVDACSPFCVCACCTTPIMVQQIIAFESLPAIIPYNREVNSFYMPVASTYSGSIWQPPQLV